MAAPGRSQIGVSRGCCRWVPKKNYGGVKIFNAYWLWLRDLAAGWVSLRFLVNCTSQLRGCLDELNINPPTPCQ